MLVIVVGAFGTDWSDVDGSPMDYASVGLVAYSASIILMNLTIAFETHTFTWINHVVVWGSILTYFPIVWIANLLPDLDMYFTMNRLFANWTFWTSVLLMVVASSVAFVAMVCVRRLRCVCRLRILSRPGLLSIDVHTAPVSSRAACMVAWP